MHPAARRALDTALANRRMSRPEANPLAGEDVPLEDLLSAADALLRERFGSEAGLCSIANARNGNCPEDCRFCAQSAHATARIESYGLMDPAPVVRAAREARDAGASCFGVVISGRGPTPRDLPALCGIFSALRDEVPGIRRAGSLGILDEAAARRLAAAGMEVGHHNLETSRRFFPEVCTTHGYDERLETLHAMKRANLAICTGALFGLGEAWADRLDLLFEIRALEPDSVPLNFLHPIPGTPLENRTPMPPSEILRAIAVARLVLPDAAIRVCGGRERSLGDLQPGIFRAGANGMMIGNYLTTRGRPVAEDMKMLNDLSLIPEPYRND